MEGTFRTFRLIFTDGSEDEVRAHSFSDSRDGKWIDFYRENGLSQDRTVRVRSTDVTRIDDVTK